jgi:tetratricopeptide (TPR) repeat protein
MKSHIPILATALALTVFLTSLVLETRESQGSRAKIAGGVAVTGSRPDTSLYLAHLQMDAQPLGGKFPDTAEDRIALLWGKARTEYFERSNPIMAADYLERILKTDAADLQALDAAAQIYSGLAWYEQAEARLLRLLELDPDADSVYRFRLGVVRMRLGNYEDALADLLTVYTGAAEDGAVNFALACAYAGMGEPDLAMQHLRSAAVLLEARVFVEHLREPLLQSLSAQPEFLQLRRQAQSAFADRAARVKL